MASIAWATPSRRASCPPIRDSSCAVRANWRPATPRSGSSRMWPRTATRSAGWPSSTPTAAATSRSTSVSACCASG
eukprot:1862-Eustigmatos_ZCMA.PRE.1